MSRIATLIGFELRLQSRDFLTWLSAVVFLLLTVGYTSTGVIGLVGALGDIPRDAPWALAQAMAGVTAFGQVITAMTAATTVLRDVGSRSQDMVLTTSLPWPQYLLGRFLGTLAVLALVYCCIPLGLAAGELLSGDGLTALSWAAYVRPLLLLVLPNVLTVAALFFAAGALSGGFVVILFVGLGLIALWQTGLGLAASGATVGALLDPFGNAALTLATSDWDAAARATQPLPADRLLLLNRALWGGVALATLAATLRWWRPRVAALPARSGATSAPGYAVASMTAPAALRGATMTSVLAAEMRFGLRWVLRERGFVTLLALALLNAVANGWSLRGNPAGLVQAVEFHARLFGILVATIYAGELVWRDRDVRAQDLLGTLPFAPDLRLLGRSIGVGVALLALPLALWLLTMTLPLLGGGAPAASLGTRWILGLSAPGFLLLLATGVVVHRVVGHKTGAHLLIIGSWVLAIALGADALAKPIAAIH